MHFWPAFTVISVTSWSRTGRTRRVPGAASGPRIEEFSESASALNRTACCSTGGMRAQLALAVRAEPVNATMSWPVEVVEQVAEPPAMSCRLPSGSSPDSTIWRTTASVR